ncbi:MAG TPA: hypothetical protein PLM56_12120 [Cyclobacteriaceae bacterium]|jgi:hypothetical protein|nr:hypothetical protein [Cytophagales bacterium]HMR57494.1 hypothetical protein [Cyclobacteriaceae bacterium]HNT51720.1 hypothetical protein [Cyclobacteriaceae bacterium]HRE66892.1 hypothetical protein [Cyclobacteriaceae bacterium]HRF34239.1 hypothetical protein [Cyclobacteriaceae bacterium]
MRKLLIMAMWLASSWCALAQDQPEAEQDPKVLEKINALRIAYISEKLGLTTTQAEKFWPVYREFSDKRKDLRQELIGARKQLKQGEDPDKDAALIKLGLELKQRELDLEKTYSDRLLKVITAQQILNLRKAEGDFQQMIRDQIQQRRMMQQRNETIRERNQRLKQQQKN